MFLAQYIKDFAGLIYPKVCYACGNALLYNEHVVCTYCQHELPETNFHNEENNKLDQFFWGRVHLEAVTALFFYQKGCKVQKLIHKLKYQGKREIGFFSGKLLASRLRTSAGWNTLDMVLPVPLHPKKQRQRGYNQSECFARGLSEGLNISLTLNNLIRKFHSESQTRKTRFMRWKNVEAVYHVKNPEVFKNKNLLLVDDVITTGSTIEACSQKLLETAGVKIWVAAIAIAS